MLDGQLTFGDVTVFGQIDLTENRYKKSSTQFRRSTYVHRTHSYIDTGDIAFFSDSTATLNFDIWYVLPIPLPPSPRTSTHTQALRLTVPGRTLPSRSAVASQDRPCCGARRARLASSRPLLSRYRVPDPATLRVIRHPSIPYPSLSARPELPSQHQCESLPLSCSNQMPMPLFSLRERGTRDVPRIAYLSLARRDVSHARQR